MNTNMKQIKKRNVAEIKHCDKITMLRPLADYNNTLSKCTVKNLPKWHKIAIFALLL